MRGATMAEPQVFHECRHPWCRLPLHPTQALKRMMRFDHEADASFEVIVYRCSCHRLTTVVERQSG